MIESGAESLSITDSRMTRFLLSLEQACELIDWAYYHPSSHGKIAVPKIKSMRVIDIARCLIDSYKKTDRVKLKTVGVRPGEKIHEELISSDEWGRTERSLDNYLIGTEKIDDERKSFNSENSLMDESEIFYFLKENGVV